MSDVSPSGDRLDSWKAIAEYLQRDVATVARWEKSLGLPIRRVEGGRSVFAYTSEIDAWLQVDRPGLALPDDTLSPSPDTTLLSAAPAAAVPTSAYPWRWLVPVAAVLALVAGLLARPRPIAADDLRVELTPTGVIARDSDGVERWRHQFPATYTTHILDHPFVAGSTPAGVYFATSYRGRGRETVTESGTLTFLDITGSPQRSFSFDDRVTFQGTSYEAPWALTAFAVKETEGTRRVAVAAHHHTWDPSLVTILDHEWRRRGTFVHAGWIEDVRWRGPARLLIAGFSNPHDGGMIALLDAAALEGQGPEAPGSRHFCETCGTGRPLRMFVFPRSALNRITASRFNRPTLQTFDDGRVTVHTIEVPSGPDGDADALYEFSASLDLVSARYSERYWAIHRALEIQGKITHSREQCDDRDGPRQVQMWEPATGWQTLRIRPRSRGTRRSSPPHHA